MFPTRIVTAVLAAAVVASLPGCGMVSSMTDGVSNPLTPEQSRAQVIEAARDVIGTLNLDGAFAAFKRTSCNDQAEPPFRSEISIDYDHPATYDESQAQVEKMVETLRSNGWTGDPDFRTHAAAVTKNNVVATFIAYNPNHTAGGITILGECRDVTTQDKLR
jgi:hypothetical protein